MHSYFAYGLNIQSELPFPELPAGDEEPDVAIRLKKSPGVLPQGTDRFKWMKLTRQLAVLYVKTVGVFTLSDGREVIVTPAPGVGESLLRLLILGPVMAALLYQRGKLVLHASTARVNGSAVAFMGGVGSGKSSILAALCQRGHTIVADDVTAVDIGGSQATVYPGFPQLKISPEVALTLGRDDGALIILDPQVNKRGWRLPEGFQILPLPLKRIYVLSEGTVQEINPLRPQEAVIELVRHTFPTRFLHSGEAAHLSQCARLARKVPIQRLNRSRDLSMLLAEAVLVEEDLINVGIKSQY